MLGLLREVLSRGGSRLGAAERRQRLQQRDGASGAIFAVFALRFNDEENALHLAYDLQDFIQRRFNHLLTRPGHRTNRPASYS